MKSQGYTTGFIDGCWVDLGRPQLAPPGNETRFSDTSERGDVKVVLTVNRSEMCRL